MSVDDAGARSHLVTWGDPMQSAVAAMRLSGLEFFQAMVAGEVPPPPISALMNMHGVEVGVGRMVFAATPGEQHYNPIGMVHGGFAATLCDSAMGCAVHSTLALGKAYTTLEIKVNYIRAITLGSGEIRCEGVVDHVGNKVATASARLTDAQGRLCATATTTCLIFDVPGMPA